MPLGEDVTTMRELVDLSVVPLADAVAALVTAWGLTPNAVVYMLSQYPPTVSDWYTYEQMRKYHNPYNELESIAIYSWDTLKVKDPLAWKPLPKWKIKEWNIQ
jgi:hypothetical protein